MVMAKYDGLGLCDGNAIVNLMANSGCDVLMLFNFQNTLLASICIFPLRIIATEQEGVISTPKWTGMKKKNSKLSQKQRHLSPKSLFLHC